jgi:hypothetical protein
MFCRNQDPNRRPFEAAVEEITPGFTLADATGTKRIRMLEDCKRNLLAIIAEKQDEIRIIDHELSKMHLSNPEIQQTPILDMVVPVRRAGNVRE